MASIISVEITGHTLTTYSGGAKAIKFEYDVTTSSTTDGETLTLDAGYKCNGNGELHSVFLGSLPIYNTTSGIVTFSSTWVLPFDYLFCGMNVSFYIKVNGVRSPLYSIYLPAAFSLPASSFMIPERPTQHDQWVYYDGTYMGNAGCCVASALAAAKEVQEIRSGRGVIQNSVGWFFGATADNEYGTTYATALNFLRDHGMMPARYVQTSHVSRYPDVYFYNDSSGYSGGRSLYLNNNNDTNSLPQKITSWKLLSGEWNEPFGWQSIFDAIQRTSGKSSSAVLVTIGIDSAFETTGSDGIMPGCSGDFIDGHMMLVLGWKTIGGVLHFVCQNSWGASWGDDGLVYIPVTNIRCLDSSRTWTGICYFWEIVDDPSAPELGIAPWDWRMSNGLASAEATIKAYNAVTSNGSLLDFSYLVWNDMVDKVKAILDHKGYSWATTFATYSETKMSSSDKNLTAKRFNSLRFNIGSHYSTGIETVDPGDTVYGWYFTKLTECMNHMI